MLVSCFRARASTLNSYNFHVKRSIKMATAQKIYIEAGNTGLWKVKQTADSAKKASELLQQDLEVSSPHYPQVNIGLILVKSYLKTDTSRVLQ